MGSGKISFKGCFHDMPWGLQTHIYAPMNVDLRNKWQIAGNQPGEPPEARELGIGAPADGLYLREDIEIKCNITVLSFVKKELKAASKVLVERLIKKAELLDAGVLHAMMEDGKLKTFNPADRSSTMHPPTPRSPNLVPFSPTQAAFSPQMASPRLAYQLPQSPTLPYGRPGSAREQNGYAPHPQFSPQPQFASHPQYAQHPQFAPHPQYAPHLQHSQGPQSVAMELPGDYYHAPQDSSHLQPPNRYSTTNSDYSGGSPVPNDGRWSAVGSDYQSSASSRPSSYMSDASGMRSPGLDQKVFASELPTMQESREEHEPSLAEKKVLEAEGSECDSAYPYGPRDYATSNHSPPPPRYREVHEGETHHFKI